MLRPSDLDPASSPRARLTAILAALVLIPLGLPGCSRDREAATPSEAATPAPADLDWVKPLSGTPEQAPRDLIERAVKRKGGLAKLESIRTVRTRATTDGRAMDITIEYPNRYLVEYYADDRVTERLRIDLQAGEVAREVDGRVAAVSEAEKLQVIQASKASAIPLLLAAARPSSTLRHAGDAEVMGRRAHRVDVETAGAFAATLFIDAGEADVVAIRYQAGGVETTVVESDFRDVSGVRVAHRSDVAIGPRRHVGLVRSVAINP